MSNLRFAGHVCDRIAAHVAHQKWQYYIIMSKNWTSPLVLFSSLVGTESEGGYMYLYILHFTLLINCFFFHFHVWVYMLLYGHIMCRCVLGCMPVHVEAWGWHWHSSSIAILHPNHGSRVSQTSARISISCWPLCSCGLTLHLHFPRLVLQAYYHTHMAFILFGFLGIQTQVLMLLGQVL